jgi:alanyl-tRNA synthetase
MADRLYYADSHLKNFEATVSDVREHSRKDGVSVWQIALDRTAFYPTSGGQPHDTGTLTAKAPSGASLSLPVTLVEEDDSGEVWHATAKPLPAGTRVSGEIDWRRRLDHMQQHSGQHLLSAIIAREYGAMTVSFHLGDEASTIDLAVESLRTDQLLHMEELANLAIAENAAVSVKTIDAEEAKALLAAGALRKLPEREGTIRLVEMPGIDLNACGGTHVQALGQIGGLLLRGTERVRQGVRLSFVCGLRAVRAAHHDDHLLTQLGIAMSVQRASLPEAIERKLSEAKRAAKEQQKLREDLADYHAARLLVEDPIEHGKRLVVRQFADRDAGYIKLLASRLVAAAPQTIALLASTEQEPAALVFARSVDLAAPHCGEVLGGALAVEGLRGGGSQFMAQGQVPVTSLGKVMGAIEAAARS